MKDLLAVLLTISLVTLVGCGPEASNDENQNQNQNQNQLEGNAAIGALIASSGRGFVEHIHFFYEDFGCVCLYAEDGYESTEDCMEDSPTFEAPLDDLESCIIDIFAAFETQAPEGTIEVAQCVLDAADYPSCQVTLADHQCDEDAPADYFACVASVDLAADACYDDIDPAVDAWLMSDELDYADCFDLLR